MTRFRVAAIMLFLLLGGLAVAIANLQAPTRNLKSFVQEGKVGFKDSTSGEIVIDAKYDNARGGFAEGLAAVAIGPKWGYIDHTGVFVVEPSFESANSFYEGLAALELSGHFGFIDRKGNVAIEPQYDQVSHFAEGMAAIRQGEKWGYIDKRGRIVLPLRYEYASAFRDRLAIFSLKGKSGVIDDRGNVVIEPVYDSIVYIDGEDIRVCLNGLFATLNRKGERQTEWVGIEK